MTINDCVFQVYGTVEETDGYERLEFHHSNSIVHPPRATYTPDSVFMAFDHYNVENRDRVKCVTASEGGFMIFFTMYMYLLLVLFFSFGIYFQMLAKPLT